MNKVGVLGDGITAKAVRRFLDQSPDHCVSSVDGADFIVTSPGIPPREWPETATEIISDIEFAYRILKAQKKSPTIIGVTGTNGKTTVTAGIAHALEKTPYGNIGTPLITEVNDILDDDIVVIELSSFQLFSSPTLYCNIAIIMNIESDHLDWHGSFENYKAAKGNLIKIDGGQSIYVPQNLRGDIHGEEVKEIEQLPVPGWRQFCGQHNEWNAAIILDVLKSLGQSVDEINRIMDQFKLPPFRCESVFSNDDLTIINDSKATNMAATLAAVNSFSGEKLLILCGEPKSDYSKEWMLGILKECHTVYAAGYLNNHKDVFPSEMLEKVTFFSNLKDATSSAIKTTQKGTILFSPSGASFDEFDNYLARGEAFNQYVKEVI
ncbi:hypothetical protein DID73_01775 [Candidatus Marinamargulisbacteria bacterium SCGC AG-343-K17]|nr:hypothetical protein DID73_01775 [Candidatus Marinamargulisbacteria bacterium SCGC AG-343-K17]